MACDQWIQRKGLQSCILMGLLLGLASSTKSTLIPLALGVQAAVVLSSGRGDLMRTAGQLLISITASVSILWLVYFGEGMGTKLCELELSSSLFVNWISRLIGESGLGCLPSALPPDLLHGIDFQKQEFETPSFPESYLLGTWKRGGWYTYYIVAWLVKTPVPTLLLTAVGAVQILLNLLSRSPPIEESRKHEHASGPALLSSSQAVLLIGPVLLTFLLVSSQTGFNRHLRYLVPCYPFLFLIASSVISKHRATTSRRLVCCAMVSLQAFAFFLSAPNWMSYFNLAAGGSKNGPEVLLGSNLDWGQDIYGIERWKKACKVTDPIFVLVQSDYHPTWLGIDCYSPKLGKGRGIAGPITSYETAFPKGWYLISVNYVYSNGSSQRDWLGSQFREEVPAYTIGNTIHAFFVDSAAIARINGVSNARSDE
ncbi:hypothetical protein LOC72_05020 [Roseiconus lacunae]|nr:hypothetical protein [Roseiconus lacunae]